MRELDEAGPRWSDAADRLTDLADADLAGGMAPRPTLAAFAGHHPVALVTLRTLDDPLLGVLLEVLALVLPLGADRLAVSLNPARSPAGSGSSHDRPVLAILLVDGAQHPATVTAELRDLDASGPVTRGVRVPAVPHGTASGLAVALDHRSELDPPRPAALLAQLGRLLVLGHRVALAPVTAERLQDVARGSSEWTGPG